MKNKENRKIPAPIVILVRPQLALNMGMVARAMMNCGLNELRLVRPKQSHLSQKAISSASGAQSILEQTQVYNSLSDALKDIQYSFATTARTRNMVKPVFSPQKAVLKVNSFLKTKQKVALIFGPERTGLENDDIVLSNALLSIDLNPVHPSLNLAQAVLLVGWCWWDSQGKTEKTIPNRLATQEEVNKFLFFLENILKEQNYFQWSDKKVRMVHNLYNVFMRNELTKSEIKTLYRVVKTLSKRKK